MLESIFLYLLESSLCLLILVVFYYVLLRKLTFFSWMRYYLLASVIVSLILPLINIPILNIGLFSRESFSGFSLKQNFITTEFNDNLLQSESGQSTKTYGVTFIIYSILIVIYSIGIIYKSIGLFKKLKTIYSFIRNKPKLKENNYWIVSTNEKVPAFSFFNYIFVNRQFKNLSDKDYEIILNHESKHVNQLHTLDILFIEIVSILFWFNPLITIVKKLLQELHEFIVDESIVRHDNKKNYSELLLSLASEKSEIGLSAGFAGPQIARRLKMIVKPKSIAIKKIVFSLFIPVVAVLLVSFSFINNDPQQKENASHKQDSKELIIGDIKWKGNEAYSDDVLNKTLGLRKGDKYVEDFYKPLNNTVGDLYLDNGYIFYNGKIDKQVNNGIVNLEITIFEGNKGKIGKIIVSGNNKVTKEKILSKMKLKSGDLFSRSKLIGSYNAIIKIRNISDVNPDVAPQLDMLDESGYYLIDLEIKVTEN